MNLQASNTPLTRFLHGFAPLRALAKRALAGTTIEQRFHGGVICLNAVEHAWAWTGRLRYESFDALLQTVLVDRAKDADVFIDIGSNLGAMTLSVVLHAPHVRAVSVDPNGRAVQLLKRSLARNRLTTRVTVIEAAAGSEDGSVIFDDTGSVTGHVSDRGRTVRSIDIRRLIAAELARGRCVLKMDVEGYETRLLPLLADVEHKDRLTVVVEVHALEFNDVGDPERVLATLRAMSATLTTLDGQPIDMVPASAISQIVACWS